MNLRWTALLVPMSLLAACDPHDEDQLQGAALTGDRMVIAANTTTVGGYGCGGGDDGRPALLVSADGGRSFDRIEPATGRAIAGVAAHGGEFFLLSNGGDGGFVVESSTDGVTWTERTSGTGGAYDLTADATGIRVAHTGGVLESRDGVAWGFHSVEGAGLYAPHLAHVGARFVIATADGAVSTSSDGETWTPRTVETLASVHRLAGAGGRAIAIAHAERGGGYGSYLVAFDPASAAPATFASIADNVMAMVDAPAGVLVGDGTLAPGGDLDARRAHVGGFQAGAVDGARVILASGRGLEISNDGGATFAPAVELPLLR